MAAGLYSQNYIHDRFYSNLARDCQQLKCKKLHNMPKWRYIIGGPATINFGGFLAEHKDALISDLD